ncbi:protein kinase domain-containing protein [Microbulbifer sp. JMSA004]|uniref:protein kinase domain-containing protein n=1 Tax=Microbulbifer sp. JMSA004 TaxID=3243370 RepID=UPI00403A5CA4
MDVVALEKTEEYQGRYRVERTLGAGGMGVVYLAEDVKLRRKVAIKRLRSDLSGNSAEARFRSEAELLARLNHPNIVRLYDVLEENTGIALVMELVEGVTLKEWLRENSPTLAIKLDLLMQICQGLSKAHSLGIIHRDLKLENILVTNDGVAKITDFGIAKALDCDQQLTREDHIAGSIQAMSPEQVQGAPLDARSDLFSLGSIAYELLCNNKPFERGDLNALAFAQQICSAPHIPPQTHWPEIPKPLVALLDRLLSKRPEQRPDSAQQVFEALSLVRHHGIDADTQQYSETVTQLLIKPRKKHRRLTSFLVALIALGATGFWGWKTYSRLPPQYIAILPIELSGKTIDESTDSLVKAMVRQALMSTPSHLKSSALVSYIPRREATLNEQLRHLGAQGITDALSARLDCVQSRCNIEIQVINPLDKQVKKQTAFAFLPGQLRQEAQYSIRNSAIDLFPKRYHREPGSDIRMSPEDYNHYLHILSKLATTATEPADLEASKELIGKYPKNSNLYSLYASIATKLYLSTNDSKLLTSALGILASAESTSTDKSVLLEAQLYIKSTGTDREGFESILSRLQAKGYPSAHLLAQYARFHYSQGNYKQGLYYAEQASALNPSAHNLYIVAINQIQIANYNDARKTLNDLLDKYPEFWSAYAVIGVIELEQGNLERAKRAITTIPEQFRTLSSEANLGVVYFLQGKYQLALEKYRKVISISPNNLTAIYQVAETHQMLGNNQLAINGYEKILQITSNIENEGLNTQKYRFRAIALANLNRHAESIVILNKLLKLNQDETDIKYSAALIYALSEEWRSANYYIEELIEQGMGAEWFALPAFQKLCTQPQTSQKVLQTICNY